MSEPSTIVKADNVEFDVAGIGNWVSDNLLIGLVIALVAFIFYLFRRDGFAVEFLRYRIRREELKADQAAQLRALVEANRGTLDTDEPFLPFEDRKDLEGK